MKTFVLASAALIAVSALCAESASAQRVRAARENVAGGVTAGRAHDVSGPFGGRAVAEGGVVTNGDGAGVGGSRGCARGAAGGRGCSAGSTVWDRDGNISHERSAAFEGPFGATGSSTGGFDADGDLTGNRSTELDVGDRTYSAETSFESGEGFDRNVTCSGSSCR